MPAKEPSTALLQKQALTRFKESQAPPRSGFGSPQIALHEDRHLIHASARRALTPLENRRKAEIAKVHANYDRLMAPVLHEYETAIAKAEARFRQAIHADRLQCIITSDEYATREFKPARTFTGWNS